MTWIWDLKKDRVQWYGNMAQHLGLGAGSFSGRFQDYLRHVHPDDMARAKSTFVACLKGTTPEYRSEERVLWSDGSEHWLETYGRASYGPDGNAVRLSGVIKNITQRKHQEAARARAEQLVDQVEREHREVDARYRTLFESAVDGMLIGRPDGVLLDVNPALCRVTGYAREELVGRNFRELLNPAELETTPVRTDFTKRWDRVERAVPRKRGGSVSTEIVSGPMPDGNVLAILRDITERKRAEETLAASESRFRSLTELSSDAFWQSDPEHRITTFEPSTGYSPMLPFENLIGKTRWETGNMHPADPRGWAPLREAMNERRAFRDFEISMGPINGEVRWYAISGEPLYGVADVFLGYQGVTRQITERKLAEESLRRFRLAMDSSGDAIVLVDRASMRYVDVNQTLCDLVGYTRQEVLAMTPMELFGTSREILERDYDSLIADKDSSSGKIEGQYRHKDGSLIPIETSRRAMNTGSGWIIVANARDITERKRAEDELRSSRRMLEMVIDAIPMSIFAKDTKSNYVMANKYAADFFQTSKQALINLHTSRLPTHDATRRQALADDDWVYQNRKTFVHETLVHRPDGTLVPFHSSKIPLFDEGGELIGLLGINRDISQERCAQEALRESEQRFRAVFERSKAGIAIWGLDGRFLSVNNAFCDFVGYSADELIGGMSAGNLRHPGEDDGLDLTGRMLRGEIAHITRDRPYRRRDAGTVWGRTSVAGVRNKEGVLQYFVAVVIDITEAHDARKRIEILNVELDQRVQERTAELSDAISELEEANRELDSFNFSISHDLRQPLNAIAGFSDLLNESLNGDNGGDALEFVHEIETNASRMEQMIEALLRFARTGRGSVEKVEVNMQHLIDSVLGDLATAGPLRAEISVGRLPPAQGDGRLLRQVWTNLLGNALKYSGKGSAPKIEIRGALTNGTMEYTVRDNGVGFDMRDAEHIFGVFQRLPSSSGFEGSGVGLAIVQRIVHRHGGKVAADSAPGKGATFRFTLPA